MNQRAVPSGAGPEWAGLVQPTTAQVVATLVYMSFVLFCKKFCFASCFEFPESQGINAVMYPIVSHIHYGGICLRVLLTAALP